MKAKFEEACSQISIEEIQKLFIARWKREKHQSVIVVPYTFDLNSVSKITKDDILTFDTGVKFKNLSQQGKSKVHEGFKLWESACGNLIEFKHVKSLKEGERGITVVACDNLTKAHGVATYVTSSENFFNRVLICLPGNVTSAFDKRCYVHEIGHALGIDHVHDVESIKVRLQELESGMGCSVMGYNNILATGQNNCTISDYCENEIFGVKPGPMDGQICKAIYKFPPIMQSLYFRSLFLGAGNGALMKGMSSFLGKIEILNMNQEASALVSAQIMMLLHWYLNETPMNLPSTLGLMEILARFKGSDHANSLKVMRVLAELSYLLFSMYELYSDQDALVKSIYLGTFLAGNYCGFLWGEELGECIGSAANTAIKNLGSFFSTSFDITFQGVTSLRNWFFALKPPIESPSDLGEIARATVFN